MKFQASILLLCLYSLVCVGPGYKPNLLLSLWEVSNSTLLTVSEMMPPVQQTKVIEKTQGYVRKTCFSTQPVKRCPESSSPEGITSRLIAYHCLDSSSPSTQKLVLRSHSQVLDKLRYKTVDLNQYESEPKACITQ